jgi:hypothetical protein
MTGWAGNADAAPWPAIGRPKLEEHVIGCVHRLEERGTSVRAIAKELRIGLGSVYGRREMQREPLPEADNHQRYVQNRTFDNTTSRRRMGRINQSS